MKFLPVVAEEILIQNI